jgi:3-dehydroquinate dehydratase/shikimate dehydrogenase
MTLLTTSIFARDDGDWRAQALAAFDAGADAVELRLDDFDGDPAQIARFVADHDDRAWMLTCRAADEGGRFDGDTVDRVSRLIEASRGHDAYVDFEWAHWQRSANIRQKVLLAASVNRNRERDHNNRERGRECDHNNRERGRECDHRLILSAHDFDRVPADLAERAAAIQADRDDAVVKIAAAATDVCDNFAMLDLLHHARRPMIALCMGEAGLMSRVLAGKFGAFATYCAFDGESGTAPGQLTLSEMRDRYRCHQVGPGTRVFGVIGDPVAQSMGPILHNAWFASAGVDAVYLPLLVSADPAVLTRFLDGCAARPWLDVGGFSVTVPHKVAAMRWIGAGADPRARAIGAVNTLVRDGDRWSGHNTDADAAIDSLASAMGIDRGDLRDVPVDLLGAGGSARAVAAALDDCGAQITIYNRTPQRSASLASHFRATARPWSDVPRRAGRIVINCTKVGMTPNDHDTPIDANALGGCACVFDLIYNPIETRLVRDARAAGMIALGGLDMFIRQAVRQFELWTGQTADAEQGRALIENGIRQAKWSP